MASGEFDIRPPVFYPDLQPIPGAITTEEIRAIVREELKLALERLQRPVPKKKRA